MDDLISRAAAIGCLGNSPEQMCMPWSEMERMLRELPTVDAVPVVRCKDCKFWHRDDPAGNGCECSCNGGWWLPEDYCSCGERRDTDGKDD